MLGAVFACSVITLQRWWACVPYAAGLVSHGAVGRRKTVMPCLAADGFQHYATFTVVCSL